MSAEPLQAKVDVISERPFVISERINFVDFFLKQLEWGLNTNNSTLIHASVFYLNQLEAINPDDCVAWVVDENGAYQLSSVNSLNLYKDENLFLH